MLMILGTAAFFVEVNLFTYLDNIAFGRINSPLQITHFQVYSV